MQKILIFKTEVYLPNDCMLKKSWLKIADKAQKFPFHHFDYKFMIKEDREDNVHFLKLQVTVFMQKNRKNTKTQMQ